MMASSVSSSTVMPSAVPAATMVLLFLNLVVWNHVHRLLMLLKLRIVIRLHMSHNDWLLLIMNLWNRNWLLILGINLNAVLHIWIPS